MGVDSKHPLYNEHIEDWQQMRNTFKGERVVKEQAFTYLPATASMVEDGAATGSNTDGWKAYDAYRKRASYPGNVREAIDAMLGVMHNKPPVIELPAALEDMRASATFRNESLEMLLKRINAEQLTSGRVGLLGDVIDSGLREGQPYISTYLAEHIINWDEGQMSRDPDPDDASDDLETPIEVTEPQNLNFVSLDESGFERVRQFEWESVSKYRILILGNDLLNEPQGEGVYRVGVFRDNNSMFSEDALMEVTINGRTTDEVPFVFINTKDVVSEPDDPPLLSLSDLTLTIYRGEADYRQALFNQGQDTLVVIGGNEDDTYRVGAGASINIPNTTGDAKYIGVDSQGLPEMRQALENDYMRADLKSSTMLNTTSNQAESGEALKVRVASRTATLNQVALAGAFGLEQLLKIIARWVGANPDEVSVRPNLDFVDDAMTGQELGQIMAAKSMGAPISLRSIHQLESDRGLTENTFEETVSEIGEEMSLDLGIGSSDPDGPVDDGGDDDASQT